MQRDADMFEHPSGPQPVSRGGRATGGAVKKAMNVDRGPSCCIYGVMRGVCTEAVYVSSAAALTFVCAAQVAPISGEGRVGELENY